MGECLKCRSLDLYTIAWYLKGLDRHRQHFCYEKREKWLQWKEAYLLFLFCNVYLCRKTLLFQPLYSAAIELCAARGYFQPMWCSYMVYVWHNRLQAEHESSMRLSLRTRIYHTLILDSFAIRASCRLYARSLFIFCFPPFILFSL